MKRRPRKPRSDILGRPAVVLMLCGGAWSAIVNLAVFEGARRVGKPLEEAMTLTFVTLILIQFTKAYVFRSESHALWRRPFANKWLNLAVGWEIVMLLVLVHVPFLRDVFGLHILSPVEWLVAIGAALSILPILETIKWAQRRMRRGPLDPAEASQGSTAS